MIKKYRNVGILILVLFAWNLLEHPSLNIDLSKVAAFNVEVQRGTHELKWEWFDQTEIAMSGGVGIIKKIPAQLEACDQQMVTIEGASFACGNQIEETPTGYSINGFIIVPYFGMIDCCIGNPTPYFQWTLMVNNMRRPWTIKHKGFIDPQVVVKGRLRIERTSMAEGVFFIDEAEVIASASSGTELAQLPIE